MCKGRFTEILKMMHIHLLSTVAAGVVMTRRYVIEQRNQVGMLIGESRIAREIFRGIFSRMR
jgi:hypothetical protein